jgi:hypothetical protein
MYRQKHTITQARRTAGWAIWFGFCTRTNFTAKEYKSSKYEEIISLLENHIVLAYIEVPGSGGYIAPAGGKGDTEV